MTAAIDELAAEYRTVFVLHDVLRMSNPDIAATLDLTVPAVKSRVHRARLLLRRRLRDYLGEISTGTQPDGGPLGRHGYCEGPSRFSFV